MCSFQHCFRHSTVTCIVQLPKFNASKLGPALSTSVIPVVWSGKTGLIRFCFRRHIHRHVLCLLQKSNGKGTRLTRYKPRSVNVFLNRGTSLLDLFCYINCKNTFSRGTPSSILLPACPVEQPNTVQDFVNLVRPRAEPLKLSSTSINQSAPLLEVSPFSSPG